MPLFGFMSRARSSEEAPPPVERTPSCGIDSEDFEASPTEEPEDAAQETKDAPQENGETPQKETEEVPQENEQKRRRAKRLVQMDLFGQPVSERLLCEHFEALNAEPPSMALLVASGSVSMEMVMSETKEAQQETETPLKQETGETTEKREEQNEESDGKQIDEGEQKAVVLYGVEDELPRILASPPRSSSVGIWVVALRSPGLSEVLRSSPKSP
jgi:hypothetical protein